MSIKLKLVFLYLRKTKLKNNSYMKNNNPKGILYILVGMAIFSIQDALIKFVYEDSCTL